MDRKSNLILHPVFLSSVILLFVNDHFLKYTFHNWLTGKLSDFAGLIALPLLIAYCIPKLTKYACLIAALWFMYWKMPISESFIQLVRDVTHVNVYRTIDYSDFIALLVIIIPMKLLQSPNQVFIWNRALLLKPLIAIFSFITLAATSVPRYMYPKGTLVIDESYTLRVPEDSILSRIRMQGYECVPTHLKLNDYVFVEGYEIQNVIIPSIRKLYANKPDTIQKISFYFWEESYSGGRKKMSIHEAVFSDTLQAMHWKESKRYTKIYKNELEDLFVKPTNRHKW